MHSRMRYEILLLSHHCALVVAGLRVAPASTSVELAMVRGRVAAEAGPYAVASEAVEGTALATGRMQPLAVAVVGAGLAEADARVGVVAGGTAGVAEVVRREEVGRAAGRAVERRGAGGAAERTLGTHLSKVFVVAKLGHAPAQGAVQGAEIGARAGEAETHTVAAEAIYRAPFACPCVDAIEVPRGAGHHAQP
jgi:hypothetical protein